LKKTLKNLTSLAIRSIGGRQKIHQTHSLGQHDNGRKLTEQERLGNPNMAARVHRKTKPQPTVACASANSILPL
jgi:hypothetical protein